MKRFISLVCLLLFACEQQEQQAGKSDKSPLLLSQEQTLKTYKAIQGNWEDSKNEIFYIEGYEYKLFYSKSFVSGDLKIHQDTIIGLALMEFPAERVKIISSSNDSLLLLTLEDSMIIRLHRPSLAALIKDTVTVKPDSIIRSYSKKIMGHRYEFTHRSDYSEHIFLRIKNLDVDTIIPFVEDLYLKGGNCNASIEIKSAYEIIGDKLLMYFEEQYDEHMDDRYHHYSESYRIHEWVFRKNGQIISLGDKKDKSDSLIQKLVTQKLEAISP